jgi:hypothetical protein
MATVVNEKLLFVTLKGQNTRALLPSGQFSRVPKLSMTVPFTQKTSRAPLLYLLERMTARMSIGI